MPGNRADIDISEYIELDSELQDDDGNVIEEPEEESQEEPEQETSDDETSSEELDAKEEEKEGEKDPEKEEEEEKTSIPEIKDDQEIEVGEEKVTIARMKDAYINERDRHADYTRKTQVLADERREFEAHEESVRKEIDKLFTDAEHLVKTLKRKAPKALHEAMVIYGTEFSERQELSKNDPAAYYAIMEKERQENERINTQERQDREYRKEVSRVQGVIKNHLEPSLKKSGLLPEKHSKSYKQFVLSEFNTAYTAFLKDNPSERVTGATLERIAEIIAKNKEVLAELEVDKKRFEPEKKTKSKPKPKIVKVQENSGKDRGRASRRNKPERTHENFFDDFI